MTDQPDPTSGEEQERVRALLAGTAAAPTPLPGDVRDRLDAVLADLVGSGADRSEGAEPSPATDPVVVPLSRRRRILPKLLVAATAVAVIGLGIGNLLGGSGGVDSADSAGSAAEESQADAESPATPGESALESTTEPSRLRTATFQRDVERFLAATPRAAATDDLRADADACTQPATGARDQIFEVEVDGAPAVLVVRSPRDGTRRVEAFGCAPLESAEANRVSPRLAVAVVDAR